jgi:predicted Zn-dependent peptidase
VGTITREQLCAFFAMYYMPAALVISIAGRISHDEACAAFAARLGDWTGNTPLSPAPFVSQRRPRRIAIAPRKNEQANLCMAFPGLGYHDPDYDALTILSAILGEGMSSRLFQTVREDLGLVYEISSTVTAFQETGILEITAGCDPQHADAVITAILREIGHMLADPPSPAELLRIKTYMHGRLMIGMEDTSSIAAWLGSQMTLRGQIRTLDEFLARIEVVTAEDVWRVARRVALPAMLRMAGIGALPKAAHFRLLLDDFITHIEQ